MLHKTFHHYFFSKYGIILPFAMEPLNTYLMLELKATQVKLDKTEKRNTKLIEESLWLEARLDREVERTSDLNRWLNFFVTRTAQLENQLDSLNEHARTLERRLIERDNMQRTDSDYFSEITIASPTTSEGSIDLWP
jgi:predicted nuclease with TOPRIM domain